MGENETGARFVFVYPNQLKADKDAFLRIAQGYGEVRREYIVPSSSVRVEDITKDNVSSAFGQILKRQQDGEEMRVVLAGFSPLTALVYHVANELGLRCCYFIRDGKTQEYLEIAAF